MTVYHNIKPRQYFVVKVFELPVYFYNDILSGFYDIQSFVPFIVL